MGNTLRTNKSETSCEFLGFEIVNGILGIHRDVYFMLIHLMYFKNDEVVQNLVGVSGEVVEWLNHPHFLYSRNKPNFKKKMIWNYQLWKKKAIEINPTNIIFNLGGTKEKGSVFVDVLVKEMILECTIKVQLHYCGLPWIHIGISTPSQLIKAMKRCIGDPDCGACLCLYYSSSWIVCNGKWSFRLKEGGGKDGEIISLIVNNKKMKNKSGVNEKRENKGGKMNLIREGKKILHSVIGVPSAGVYVGFSSYNHSFTVHLEYLRKLFVPPPDVCNHSMRCVVYEFYGGFETNSYNHKDEDGESIQSRIREFYR